MSIHKTDAIIIKTAPFRSSSLIVTFFTPLHGKIRAVAKGVHKEGERRGAHFELFTHTEIVFYEKKRSDLHLISDAAIIESHDAIRNRLDTIAYASYFCELVDTLTEIHDPHPAIFELLKTCFHYLPVMPPSRLSSIFETKLLREMGWIPYLENCLHCGVKSLESGYFSIRQGALLCERCRIQDQAAFPVDAGALSGLRLYSTRDISEGLNHPLTAPAESQIHMLITQFFNYHINKPLNSKKFIDSLKLVLA